MVMSLRQPAKRVHAGNHLNPAIKHLDWSTEDDMLLESCARVYGTNWSKMLKHFPHRSG